MTAGLWTVARSAAAYGQYGTSGEYYKLSLNLLTQTLVNKESFQHPLWKRKELEEDGKY